jgi:hypothetical protein
MRHEQLRVRRHVRLLRELRRGRKWLRRGHIVDIVEIGGAAEHMEHRWRHWGWRERCVRCVRCLRRHHFLHLFLKRA